MSSTMPRNNEELVVQLLQVIRDDASEEDLTAHLHNTLENITDGGNEEQGNPALRDMLPRRRVYEKALEEARNNMRIKMFLLTKLERDANLAEYLSQNLPDSLDFLYRVLAIAVEFGYVELVKLLAGREGFDVNGGRRMDDFDDESGNPVPRVDEIGLTNRLTPLNLAAKLGRAEIVDTFLAPKRTQLALSPEGYWALYWAVKMGHTEVVRTILQDKDINAAVLMTLEKSLIEHKLANDFGTSFRWLLEKWLIEHRLANVLWLQSFFDLFYNVCPTPPRSGIGPIFKVSLTPPQLALFYGHRNVVKLLGERLGHGTGLTDSATEMWRDEVREIVMDIPDIQKIVKRLEKERATYVHAANSIMIVAAFIATVTFTGFLTPPPGYVNAPDMIVYAFYVYNSLSFLFAILTLLIGSSVTRPQITRTYIAVIMPVLRKLLIISYNFLYFAVIFFISTFLIASNLVFPPSTGLRIVSVIISNIPFYPVVATIFIFIQPLVPPRYIYPYLYLVCATSLMIVPNILIQIVYKHFIIIKF